MLGATLEDITMDSPGNTDPSAGRDEQGAAAVLRQKSCSEETLE
jgi:hypothetical protein